MVSSPPRRLEKWRWLWAVFVFLYPFVVLPGVPGHGPVTLAKHFYVYLFLLAALLSGIKLSGNPSLPGLLKDLRGFLRNPLPHLKKDLPVTLLALLGLTMALATLFSPEPIVALTGSLSDYTDGLLWSWPMLVLAFLAYRHSQEDPETGLYIAKATVLSAGVLALWGLLEVLLGRGFFYSTASQNLPMATFPQKGHLSGYFVLGVGVAMGLRSPWGLVLSAMGIGLAYNRTGLLALALLIGVYGYLSIRKRMGREGLRLALAVFLGVAVGMGAVRLSEGRGGEGGGAVREVGNPGTFFTRLYYWQASLEGIAHRPLLGYGGGVFEHHWAGFLDRKTAEAFLRDEFGKGDHELLEVLSAPGVDPVFILKRPDGELEALRIYSFRAHNGYLEVALKWGLPALLLYLGLLLLGLKGLFRLSPLSFGLLGIHAFFLFWFPIPEEEGVLWALWGASLAGVPEALPKGAKPVGGGEVP
ncbi:O-antigen ligase family protein [Thermus albus]|uniref:O-antigen ligase family protein n=1 Tax=Thermus albus TaxID=2908146 RepID=UPI001FA9AED0|nr:O-antigen ligase family protein [Thermus albus]